MTFGGIAQLVERCNGIAKVRSSTLLTSTIKKPLFSKAFIFYPTLGEVLKIKIGNKQEVKCVFFLVKIPLFFKK